MDLSFLAPVEELYKDIPTKVSIKRRRMLCDNGLANSILILKKAGFDEFSSSCV